MMKSYDSTSLLLGSVEIPPVPGDYRFPWCPHLAGGIRRPLGGGRRRNKIKIVGVEDTV
jgi:hypothetical protein